MNNEAIQLRNMCETDMLSHCTAGGDLAGQKRCRFYRRASFEERCMFYRLSCEGHCDNLTAQCDFRHGLETVAPL